MSEQGKAVHEYELVYIIQPEISEDDLAGLNLRVTNLIAAQSGTVTGSELWGKRALAYPIQNKFEGHYVLQRFQMDPAGTGELERLLRFSEDVLRYLVIRTDE
ncbi:MAG: 30S ribosomal protein S6 [Caldilineaceae bacterium]|nr:30S ribosomal protein S6 [Caldilineaceae bacterium]